MRIFCAVILLVTAACATPECEHDVDCEALQLCKSGSCVPIDLRKAIAGVCTTAADCSFGDLCTDGRCALPIDQQEVRCRFERDPQCPEGTLCRIIEAEPCVEGQSCEPPLACRSPAGETRSLRRCDTDAACESGTCADGICTRLCNDALACPPGYDCAPMALDGGRSANRCVALQSDGSLDPTIPLCRRDADCDVGSSCRFVDPAQCDAFGLTATCTIVPATARSRFGALCYSFSEDEFCEFSNFSRASMCPAQLCAPSCEPESSTAATVCTERRCSQPCLATQDCPLGTLCQQIGNEVLGDGEPAKQCGVIEGGCWDQVDCCPQRDVDGLCVYGWGVTEGFCGLQAVGPTTLRYCVQPDELRALPEAACVTDVDCLTGLCEPMLDGGGSRCTTLCDLGRDRCAQRQSGRRCMAPTIERLAGLHVCR